MDRASYQVVLTGELVSGFTREAVLAALARLFQTSAARLVGVFDGGDYAIDDKLTTEEAAALQKRLERLGARARVERVVPGQAGYALTGLQLPRQDEPSDAGLMHCPACGHQQLVARSCDECGVVFADYNRKRAAERKAMGASAGSAVPPQRRPPAAPRTPQAGARDIHASANARWSKDWLDEGDELPTEEYHLKLFMGRQSGQLAEACAKMMLGRRTRLMPTWAAGAVISPFLWAMYRKMWAWGLVIFITEILVPVVLFTLAASQDGGRELMLAGVGVLLLNRVLWPAILKSLYCRHARRTILYMNRLSPTYAADIDIATRGGTSRTSVFVGVVLAMVVSLLAWSIVDTLYVHWARAVPAFPPSAVLPETVPAETQAQDNAVKAQNEALVNENHWVATRNKLRVLGQRISGWFSGGNAADPAKLDMGAIAAAMSLDADTVLDGWGRPIAYESDGLGYRLISAGPDGKFGNSDDVEYRRILER